MADQRKHKKRNVALSKASRTSVSKFLSSKLSGRSRVGSASDARKKQSKSLGRCKHECMHADLLFTLFIDVLARPATPTLESMASENALQGRPLNHITCPDFESGKTFHARNAAVLPLLFLYPSHPIQVWNLWLRD